ncbi:MAG: CPBP family intramembrane glutamic endopeptidase, partial [Ilumatobacteraceae bacterium]
ADRVRVGVIVFVAIVVVLAVYNVARSSVIPGDGHFATNVAVGVGVLVAGLAAGMTKAELGIERAHLRDGLRLGGIVFVAIGAALVIAALVPFTAGYFEDERVDVTFPEMLVRVLIVIPLGTVFVEEVIFRGVLHGLLRRRFEIVRAALIGATLFGLWHLFPVWNSYSDVEPTDLNRWGSVAGTFVATFVAGLGFIWLRHRSQHLAAPILAHIGTNSIPFALAWYVG